MLPAKEITKKLAAFLVKTKYEDLPHEALNISKKVILDGIGVAIAGVSEESSRIVIDLIKELKIHGNAILLGKPLRTSPLFAALANGTMMHALDYDDESWPMMAHPTAVILPALLALGEEKGASGKEILLAYTLALEVGVKLARAMLPAHWDNGWHPTATFGTIAAAVGAGKLLKLNLDQMRSAIGIAASEAGGIQGNVGTMTKHLHAGKASSDGMLAALLAQRGFTANPNIIEDNSGFCRVFAGDGKYNLESITDKLGDPFESASSRMSIKLFPSCFNTHAGIEAALDLVNSHRIFAEDVKEVRCIMHPLRADFVNRPHVHSPSEGRFSIQYCLATAILEKGVNLEHFESSRFPMKRSVQEIIKKIIVEGNQISKVKGGDEIEKLFSIVKVKLQDGREYTREVSGPKFLDSKVTILEDFLLIQKYRECSAKVFGEETIAKSIEIVSKMEKIDNIRSLTSLFSIENKQTKKIRRRKP